MKKLTKIKKKKTDFTLTSEESEFISNLFLKKKKNENLNRTLQAKTENLKKKESNFETKKKINK